MKYIIFLVATACLLAGCAGDSKPDFKVAVQGGERQTPPLQIATEPNLPVKIDIRSDKGLPVENEALQVSFKPSKANWVALLCSVVAAIATIAIACLTRSTAKSADKSANAARESVEATQHVAEGQLFLVLMKECSSKKMQDDVTKIEECTPMLEEMEKNREAAEYKFSFIPRLADDAEGKNSLADAYYHVSCYLLNALSLYKLKYISKDCFKSVCRPIVYTTDILDILKHLGKTYLQDRSPRDNEINPKKVDEKVAKLHKDFDDIRNIIYE